MSIFVVFEVFVLLDKSNKALALVGVFHLTYPLVVLIHVKFKYPTRLRALFITYSTSIRCVAFQPGWLPLLDRSYQYFPVLLSGSL